MKEQLSRCCREVEAFGKADQLDPDSAELLQQPYQMQKATPEPVDLPHEDGIEPARATIIQHLIQSWPRVFGATDTLVAVFSDNLEATPGG